MVSLGPSALIRRNFNASAFSDIIEKSVLPAVVCARPFPFSPWQSPHPTTSHLTNWHKARSIKKNFSQFDLEDPNWPTQSPDLKHHPTALG